MSQIELRHLRYFIAVADELHFGRAAERLHISQPPLSQQIQALEAHVGAALFYRSNRSVRLTQAGQVFLTEARQILQRVDDVSAQAARIHRGESGNLTLGLTSSAPFLSRVSSTLHHFRLTYPDVNIRIEQLNSKQQIDPLLEGRLDLGIMRNGELPPELEHHLVLTEPLIAVVHKDHPLNALADGELTFEHLADQPFVFFSKDVGTSLYDDILGQLKAQGITPYITQEVGEPLTIIGLVAAGLGVSILPASYLRIQVEGVRYLRFGNLHGTTQLWLVNHATRPLTAATRTFMALLLHDD
ncbi:LysR family transcriptional regulator [Rahnella woolbedingensis]|uniref:LysR family transcriptional regulator n=1 Tax=Rahnella woolbedingensis TaxID=1510574 RepID=A0A419N8P6_9GAMM|nr:LysR substrate-binding domain-containing protein [Rahnella woolbedingensis]RJT44049.1 LysR family transcriptional regulator [Rahnella woolbedingensis]